MKARTDRPSATVNTNLTVRRFTCITAWELLFRLPLIGWDRLLTVQEICVSSRPVRSGPLRPAATDFTVSSFQPTCCLLQMVHTFNRRCTRNPDHSLWQCLLVLARTPLLGSRNYSQHIESSYDSLHWEVGRSRAAVEQTRT